MLIGPSTGPKLKLLSSDLITFPLTTIVREVRPLPLETPLREETNEKLEEDEELDEL